MKYLLTLLIFASLFGCNGANFKVMKHEGGEKYSELSRLIVGGGQYLAYPGSDRIYFFNSLDFSKPFDSLVIADSLWITCMTNYAEGKEHLTLIHPDRLASNALKPKSQTISIDRMQIFEDSIILCQLKVMYGRKDSGITTLFATYPVVIFNRNTKVLLDVFPSSYSIDDYRRNEIEASLPTIRLQGGLHYLFKGKLYDPDKGWLKETNTISLFSSNSQIPRFTIQADTFPAICTLDPDKLNIAVRNVVLTYDLDGKLLKETRLADTTWLVNDMMEKKDDRYYLRYKYTPEGISLALFKNEEAVPFFQTPVDGASFRFVQWNEKFYVFYDLDANTHILAL